MKKVCRKILIEFTQELTPRIDVRRVEIVLEGFKPKIKRVRAIMETPEYAHWRRGRGGYHYFEDKEYGLGHVTRGLSGLWCAYYWSSSEYDFKRLKDAKAWVEEKHERRLRRRRKRT